MFVSRKYRDRAVGLIAAYILLIAGVVANGAFNARAGSPPPRVTEAAPDRPNTRQADDFSSSHHCYADVVC
jgi:hypothetical protein